MLSKEELLNALHFGNRPTSDVAMKAMDDYAKQVAVAYGHWLCKRIFPSLFGGEEDDELQSKKEELFKIFIQSLNNKHEIKQS